ncbi:thioredoxin domain-containing protein [uncultured Mailhella sp.]|uniref:DsbA family protein n=1 Tax=uncultured Mailhella sp. TaxID=1981031 RepID=UPI0025E62746|nr:thioredoxin domain-containing protein [uncultured Mailhella sp.]
MSFFRHICLTVAFLSGALMAAGDAYAAPASAPAADPAAQLEALLDEHPELILNVLKKHSEEVLDIVQMGSDKRRRTVLLEQWKKDINEPKQVAVQGRPAGGPDNAPVTIIAFSDFVCAYCHQAAYTVGNLMKRYPGKIRLIFKQIPKTESGRMAAEWFIAAYQMDKVKAWKMYALVFDRQKQVEDNALATLRTIAAEVGYDAKALEASVKSKARELDTMLAGDAADASALGFVGTPYFLVNNMVLRGALPMENFVDAVEMALAKTNTAAK